MLKIDVVAVGALKDPFIGAQAEYAKRLTRYCKLSILEVEDEKAPQTLCEAAAAQVKQKECARALKKAAGAYTIALDMRGGTYTSEAFAQHLQGLAQRHSRVAFVIGGSLGLSDELLAAADERLSFSRFTFCHPLMRVILLEQLYRAMKIQAGEAYHK